MNLKFYWFLKYYEDCFTGESIIIILKEVKYMNWIISSFRLTKMVENNSILWQIFKN